MQLKEAERKARTRRLIQAGGLVEKAGLLALDANALYGAAAPWRDRADDAEQITPIGRRLVAAPLPARPAPRMRPRNRSWSASRRRLPAA